MPVCDPHLVRKKTNFFLYLTVISIVSHPIATWLTKLWLCLLSHFTLDSFKQQLCLRASLCFLFLVLDRPHSLSLSSHAVCSSAQPSWHPFAGLAPAYSCLVLGSLKWDMVLQVGSHECLLATLLFAQPGRLLAGFAARAMLAHAQLAIYLLWLPWPFRDDTAGPCCSISQLPQMELIWSYCTCPIGLNDPEPDFRLLWALLYAHRLLVGLETWEIWGQTLPVEMRQKMGWVPQSFSTFCVASSSTPLSTVGPYLPYPSSCC